MKARPIIRIRAAWRGLRTGTTYNDGFMRGIDLGMDAGSATATAVFTEVLSGSAR